MPPPPADPHPEIVRRTFLLESVRSVAVGIQETAFITFAILIAVKQFDSGPGEKSIILAGQAVGLIGSLFIMPLVRRFSLKLNHAAGIIGVLGAIAFAFSALSARHSETGFIVGMSLGFLFMALPMPLQTQMLRHNFPDSRLGRLFSVTMVVRAVTAMVISYVGGKWLEADFENFTGLLLLFTGAAAVSAVCFWLLPSPKVEKTTERPPIFHSMRWLKEDRVFLLVICAAMAMGLGFLPASALRVDFLANEKHGILLDVATISLITGIIPSAARLLSSFFWGWLFDHVNFFRLRVAVNLMFLTAVILYYSTPMVSLIITGSILLGLARGGGEILWNLWVTKLAKQEHVGEYMSVHTFLTGSRALLAPFLGFYIADYFSIKILMFVSVGFIALSLVFLWPLLGMGKKGKTNQQGTIGE
ncbi:MAG: MFS transporter [Verrucomicrobiales bacterium]|nr:MFS transporter [Verrucomicrobiales bacterium]